MTKSIELLLWCIIPVAVGLLTIVGSVWLSFRSRRLLDWSFSIAILPTVAYSLLLLHSIFVRAAWPTFIPQVAIGIAALLLVIQISIFRRT